MSHSFQKIGLVSEDQFAALVTSQNPDASPKPRQQQLEPPSPPLPSTEVTSHATAPIQSKPPSVVTMMPDKPTPTNKTTEDKTKGNGGVVVKKDDMRFYPVPQKAQREFLPDKVDKVEGKKASCLNIIDFSLYRRLKNRNRNIAIIRRWSVTWDG